MPQMEIGMDIPGYGVRRSPGVDAVRWLCTHADHVSGVLGDDHSSLTCQWKSVSVNNLDIMDITRMPRLGDPTQPITLAVRGQLVYSLSDRQAVRQCILSRLHDFIIQCQGGVVLRMPIIPVAHQPSILRYYLTILNATHMTPKGKEMSVEFCSLTLTPWVMEELRGVPAWARKIGFPAATLLPNASLYTQLAQCLPSTVGELHFYAVSQLDAVAGHTVEGDGRNSSALTDAHLEAIIMGFEKARAPWCIALRFRTDRCDVPVHIQSLSQWVHWD